MIVAITNTRLAVNGRRGRAAAAGGRARTRARPEEVAALITVQNGNAGHGDPQTAPALASRVHGRYRTAGEDTAHPRLPLAHPSARGGRGGNVVPTTDAVGVVRTSA